MPSKFLLARRIFQNAKEFSVIPHSLDYPPVDELIKETSGWFSILGGEEETISIRRKIWLLRSTIVLSLLPFDNVELRLNSQFNSIKEELTYLQFPRERLEKLEVLIKFLIESPQNPKREKVFKILNESWGLGIKVGLVFAISRGSIPGWSKTLIMELEKLAPKSTMLELISSPKILRDRTYRQIIFPANGALSPLLNDIYNGYYTKQLDLVTYRREGIKIPQRLSLPKGTVLKLRPDNDLGELIKFSPDKKDILVDDWAQRRFWESLRGLSTGVNSTPLDHEVTIEARLVLLSNKKVYLRDDLRVNEISDLAEGRISFEDYGRRLPRKSVNQLEIGDLIVLRTSGSGDYLYDVANSLLRADGKGDLRVKALDWKPVLEQAIKQYGTEYIFNKLRERGHEMKTNHRYIGVWATDIVIRPDSENRFQDLICILYELGFMVKGNNPTQVARERWQEMKEIIRYHGKAGRKIRQDLLTELRRIIESGIKITDSYSLTVPDVSAGELSVFRVTGIDPETVEIPYHRTGVIMDMEDSSNLLLNFDLIEID